MERYQATKPKFGDLGNGFKLLVVLGWIMVVSFGLTFLNGLAG